MASGDTGNVVPGNRLRVRVPCPPLCDNEDNLRCPWFLLCAFYIFRPPSFVLDLC